MIFVLSLHRSGTQSVHAFLLQSGFKAIHNPSGRSGFDFQNEWIGKEENLNFIFSNLIEHIYPTYEAVSDNPMAALYEQAYNMFPNAKFILSIRSPEKWVSSVRRHIGDRELVTAEKIQYWKFLDFKPTYISEVTDNDLINVYMTHQKTIFEFFKEHGVIEKLCVLNIENDTFENGKILGDFLGTKPLPFPRIDTKVAVKILNN
jgi:hypothetical protein